MHVLKVRCNAALKPAITASATTKTTARNVSQRIATTKSGWPPSHGWQILYKCMYMCMYVNAYHTLLHCILHRDGKWNSKLTKIVLELN